MNSKVGRALGTAVRSGPMFSGCPSLMWKAAVLKAPFLTVVPYSEGPNIRLIFVQTDFCCGYSLALKLGRVLGLTKRNCFVLSGHLESTYICQF